MRTILTLALLALTTASAFAQTTFTVEGTVTSHESGAALEGVSVQLLEGESEHARTETDEAGNYRLQVTITSGDADDRPIEAFTLGPAYPNPSRDRVGVQVVAAEAGDYAFTVLDVLGRQIMQQRFALAPGRHEAQLNGMPAGGLYVLHVESPSAAGTTVFTATEGGGFPSITLEQAGMPSLSLAATESSDYTVRFEKPGFYDESFPIETEDTTLDAQLEAVRYGTAVYAVTVRNERFDHAVRNALVTIWDAGADSLLGHHFTDAEGNATVEYPHPLHRDGTSRLTSIEAVVERDGYEPSRETLDFEPSITREVDLPWIPQYITAVYDFRITSKWFGSPVPNVNISIYDRAGDSLLAHGMTNAEGRLLEAVRVELNPKGERLLDSFKVFARKDNFADYTMLVPVIEEGMTIAVSLEEMLTNYNITLNLYNEDGQPINTTLNVETSALTKQYTSQNGQIQLDIGLPEGVTEAHFSQLNPEYSQILIGRQLPGQRNWWDRNMYQGMDGVTVDLTELDQHGEHNLYVLSQYIPWREDSLNVQGKTFTSMIHRYGWTANFSNPVTPYVDFIIRSDHVTTREPVEQKLLDEIWTLSDDIINDAPYLPNNDTLVIFKRTQTDFEDPIWEDIIARDLWNFSWTGYDNVSTPGNTVLPTADGYIKNSTSSYGGHARAARKAEIFASLTSSHDPQTPGSGSQSQYITEDGWTLSHTGRKMFRIIYLLDPGSHIPSKE